MPENPDRPAEFPGSPPKVARELFTLGHSCSQALLCAFAPRFGLDRVTALKLAAPFGGGMARQGLQCGAVSGAMMVLGLHGGRVDPDDEATRNRCDALVVDFVDRFRKEHCAVDCNDLTGVDISDPAARQKAQEGGVFDRLCPDLVERAAHIVGELMER